MPEEGHIEQQSSIIETNPEERRAKNIFEGEKVTTMDQDQASGGINAKPIFVVFLICSLSLSPLTFQLTNSYESNNFQEDLFVYITLLSLCSIIIYLTYKTLKQRCHLIPVPDLQVKTILSCVFSSSFSEPDGPRSPRSKPGNTTNRKRIDPKYFKPKYIINELITIWGTTYTVITLGSVWVIGGTIVAGERLAQKIKTKCTSAPQDGQASSRGTGRYESFSSCDSSAESVTSSESTAKSSYRRVTSWARKSYSNARKRLNRFMGTNVPQIADSPTVGAGTGG